MLAAKSKPNCLELLLEHRVSLDVQDKYGHSALMYAIIHAPLNVKPLLKYGANPDVQEINSGETALMFAIHKHKTHLASKCETCLVEIFNARLRTFLPPLKRRTLCYAKSSDALKMAMDLLLK